MSYDERGGTPREMAPKSGRARPIEAVSFLKDGRSLADLWKEVNRRH